MLKRKGSLNNIDNLLIGKLHKDWIPWYTRGEALSWPTISRPANLLKSSLALVSSEGFDGIILYFLLLEDCLKDKKNNGELKRIKRIIG